MPILRCWGNIASFNLTKSLERLFDEMKKKSVGKNIIIIVAIILVNNLLLLLMNIAYVQLNKRIERSNMEALCMDIQAQVDEDAEFETICLALDSGTSLMLYSDGLSEALNHDKEEFGTERLTNVFSVACRHHDTASAIISEVMGAVHEFEYEQNDDQTMILIRYN